MHEMSIVESFLQVALEHAEKAKAEKIVRINLVIGELTGVVQESVEFYFRFLSKETIASQAVINFNQVNTRLHCRNCDVLFYPEKHDYRCPSCHEQRVDIIAGKELHIESIEIE